MATDPRLGLGGAALGNHLEAVDYAACAAVLDAAWAEGVRRFDTAPHYGLGLSEHRLGQWLADKPRAEFRVSTKVGRRLVAAPDQGALDNEGFVVPAAAKRVWDFSEAGIRETLADSLRRLRLDRVDVAYLHDPERWGLASALATGLPALAALKAEGLVASIGVGSMDLRALTAAAETGLVDELMVAGRYTLIDQRAEARLLPACVEHGVRVTAAAVFNGGLLAERPTAASTYDYEKVAPDTLATAERLHEACAAAGVELPAAALQFPLRHRQVAGVVVGVRTPEQVRRNAQLLRVPISDELWGNLTRIGGAA